MHSCRLGLMWPIQLICSRKADILAPAVLPEQRSSTPGCSQLTRGTRERVWPGHRRLLLAHLGVNFFHQLTAARAANLEQAPNTARSGPTHYAHIVKGSPAHSGRVVASVWRAFLQRPWPAAKCFNFLACAASGELDTGAWLSLSFLSADGSGGTL